MTTCLDTKFLKNAEYHALAATEKLLCCNKSTVKTYCQSVKKYANFQEQYPFVQNMLIFSMSHNLRVTSGGFE
jgi:hypothetical protein